MSINMLSTLIVDVKRGCGLARIWNEWPGNTFDDPLSNWNASELHEAEGCCKGGQDTESWFIFMEDERALPVDGVFIAESEVAAEEVDMRIRHKMSPEERKEKEKSELLFFKKKIIKS